MSKVHKDEQGLFIESDGNIARPQYESMYKEGDNVKTHHFGGSTLYGVGKDRGCRMGEYKELWKSNDK